jgi:hypothetical protein
VQLAETTASTGSAVCQPRALLAPSPAPQPSLASHLFPLPPALSPLCLPVCLQGVHPRIIADGFELAKNHAVEFLERFRVVKGAEAWKDREFLVSVAKTALRTKLHAEVR